MKVALGVLSGVMVVSVVLGTALYYRNVERLGLIESANHNTDQYAAFVLEYLQASNGLPSNASELGRFLGDPTLGEDCEFVGRTDGQGFTIVFRISDDEAVEATYSLGSNRFHRVSSVLLGQGSM